MWLRCRFSPDTLDDGASNSSLARTLGQLAAGAGADGAAAPGHVMFNRRAEGARRDSGPANGVMVRRTETTVSYVLCVKQFASAVYTLASSVSIHPVTLHSANFESFMPACCMATKHNSQQTD